MMGYYLYRAEHTTNTQQAVIINNTCHVLEIGADVGHTGLIIHTV